MSSNQQRREAAKRKLQRQNQRRVQQAKAAHQRLVIVGVIAAVLVIAGGAWLISSLVSHGNDTATKSPSGTTGTADAAGTGTDAASPTGTASDTAAPTSTAPATECSYPKSGTAAKTATPPTDLNPPKTGTVDATLTLDTGDVTIALDRATAPCAVNSFVSLADQHYFDSTTCHRLTTADTLKVLQCGDPSGTGTGGPGYSFADELAGNEKYTTGVVAMANAGADTNGSQFFIVYGDSQLDPNYTILGKVSAGMSVIQAIADKGVKGGGQDGQPADPVTIEKVTVAS